MFMGRLFTISISSEVKIRVTPEVFFDDPLKVVFVDFNLAFYKPFVLVLFHRINITHLDSCPAFHAGLFT
jgi:hypothetical protein